MFNCPYCGQSLPDDSYYCESCGNKVTRFSEQEPTPVEAVKPAKKGKSLKLFFGGMLAVIVIVCILVVPHIDFDSIFNQGEDTSKTEQTNSTEDASSDSDTSKGQSSAASSTTPSIESVVGTWTDTDGNSMIFNADGSLLCAQVGNNGAYTTYYPGIYDQKKDTIEFQLGIDRKSNFYYKDIFDTKSYDSVTATLVDNTLQVPLQLGETAVLTHTSTTDTYFAPLTKVVGTVIAPDSSESKRRIEANGYWESDKGYGYWLCYTGKKAGKDYGNGTIVCFSLAGTEGSTYTIPAN